VTTYLEIKKNDFYRIETTVDGVEFVTARGWEDLSTMIKLYEKQGYTVDERLISQYVQHERVAKDFAIYYDLYNKYKSDYQLSTILDGTYSEEIRDRAKAARFDERLTLVGLLLESVTDRLKEDIDTEDYITELHKVLLEVRESCEDKTAHIDEILGRVITTRTSAYRNEKRSGILTRSREAVLRKVIMAVESYNNYLRQESISDVDEGFAYIKETFAGSVADMKSHLSESQSMIENMFLFIEDVFGSEQEMLVAVTELTVNYYSAKFISRYGCEKYFEHNKELLVYERQQELLSEIMLLNEEEEINLSI
jgi:hypothetical protein